MSSPDKKFYVTTPIYYVNARPHIGHAYTTIVADVVARRHRLLGETTWFLTGTDEHGQKIERSAAAAGIPPQQFADGVSQSFQDLWARMGITHNDFIRTTEPRHKQGAQKLFAELYARGEIYLSSYTGQYCVSEEMFVEGPPGTIGPDGRPTETVTEENFFFRLSTYQLPLLNLIENGPDGEEPKLRITPEARRNEVLSFLRGDVNAAVLTGLQQAEGGDGKDALESYAHQSGSLKRTAQGESYVPGALKDLSVSRSSFTWGIPVPEPAASAAKDPHVIYVWLDALANYMTALGYGSDDSADQARFQEFWPADLHLVGKEIIRFHCVYWPAFLLAAGLPLPKSVVAHGWLLFEESKMSKSRGNIVRTETILDAFGEHYRRELVRLGQPEPTKHDADLFASDVLRYFLLREIPFGQDGSFSFDAMITRYNADLANGYGNLVSRVLNLQQQFFSSVLIHGRAKGTTAIGVLVDDPSKSSSIARDVVDAALNLPLLVAAAEEACNLSLQIEKLQTFLKTVDGMISETAPWKLLKTVQESAAKSEESLLTRSHGEAIKRLDLILYTAAESIRILTALLYPILPYSTAKVWTQLGLGDIEQAAREGKLNNLQWGGLTPGTKLGPLAPIFPRAPKELAQIMTDMETKPSLTQVTADNDATTSERTEFVEAPISDVALPTRDQAADLEPTSPAAPPRTSTLPHSNPGAQVGASSAPAVVLPRTPSHVDAEPSGVFAGAAAATPITSTPATLVPQITIDDFAKVELRVAKILVAERIPKADKLLRLEVDLGPLGQRQILSGIAEWYTPESLIGRKIVVITNLAPRKMRGLESHGMLLAASHGEDGKPVLATFAEEIEVGARLK